MDEKEMQEFLGSLRPSGKKRFDFTFTTAEGEELKTSYMAENIKEAVAWFEEAVLGEYPGVGDLHCKEADFRYFEAPDGKPVAFFGHGPWDSLEE